MKKQFETEVLGQLTRKQFEDLKLKFDCLDIFTEQKAIRRLSIQLTDYARHDLDTRIRITNGHTEIMQKIGDWNATSREELSVALPLAADVIFNNFRILNNILHGEDIQKNIIQMESYIYLTDTFEVKLTHQYGGSDAYNFEVEAFDGAVNPLEVCKEFGLSADMLPKDAAYWDEFNKRVNLEVRKLSEEQLLAIISEHCTSRRQD